MAPRKSTTTKTRHQVKGIVKEEAVRVYDLHPSWTIAEIQREVARRLPHEYVPNANGIARGLRELGRGRWVKKNGVAHVPTKFMTSFATMEPPSFLFGTPEIATEEHVAKQRTYNRLLSGVGLPLPPSVSEVSAMRSLQLDYLREMERHEKTLDSLWRRALASTDTPT